MSETREQSQPQQDVEMVSSLALAMAIGVEAYRENQKNIFYAAVALATGIMQGLTQEDVREAASRLRATAGLPI